MEVQNELFTLRAVRPQACCHAAVWRNPTGDCVLPSVTQYAFRAETSAVFCH